MKMNADLYNYLMQVFGAMYGAMQTARNQSNEPVEPLPPLLQVRSGYAESPAWFMVQAAEFDPEPLDVENLRVRDIYASPRIVQALLEMLAGEKWFERIDERFHLTAEGRSILKMMRARTTRFTKPLEAKLAVDLAQLEGHLRRIIDASLACTEQPGTWCLAHSRNRAPAADASSIEKISQYFSDFNAFRDDAHMAAWQAHGVDGHTWEAFSFIVSGAATTAKAVYEQIFYRGYAKDEFAAALDSLAERNWLEQNAEESASYQVTATGQEIWNTVEKQTDAYFYAPWSGLSETELLETHALLQQFEANLKAIT